VPHFHIVFTLPHALNSLIRQNQARCYDLLFFCAAVTLLEFGRRELQAQLGITTVLHSWSQTLLDHYHLHCIVTGGGLREDGKLEFHGQLQPLAAPAAFGQLIRQATRKKWVVYAKRPFAGPKVVLAYLARYTHRVGITNHRILDVDKTTGTVRAAPSSNGGVSVMAALG
jgi:hypothetical protein